MAAGQTGRRSVTSCPLSASLFSYHCAATLFLTHFNFPLEQKRIPSGKILQLSQEVQYKRHEPVLGLKESREQSNSLVPTLSLFQSLGRVAWKPALGHFVLHFTVMNSFVIYILSVRPTFKKPIAQVSQV